MGEGLLLLPPPHPCGVLTSFSSLSSTAGPGRVALGLHSQPSTICQGTNTPVGRSRQSPGSSHCTQVCRNSQAPASITSSSWHKSRPLPPSSPELPPQESPPIPLRRTGYEEEGARINQPWRGCRESSSDLLPKTNTGVPSLLISKGHAWSSPPPHGPEEGQPLLPPPLRCHPCAYCTEFLFWCHHLTVESEK